MPPSDDRAELWSKTIDAIEAVADDAVSLLGKIPQEESEEYERAVAVSRVLCALSWGLRNVHGLKELGGMSGRILRRITGGSGVVRVGLGGIGLVDPAPQRHVAVEVMMERISRLVLGCGRLSQAQGAAVDMGEKIPFFAAVLASTFAECARFLHLATPSGRLDFEDSRKVSSAFEKRLRDAEPSAWTAPEEAEDLARLLIGDGLRAMGAQPDKVENALRFLQQRQARQTPEEP